MSATKLLVYVSLMLAVTAQYKDHESITEIWISTKMYFNMSLDGEDIGQIVFGLFGYDVPVAVDGVLAMATHRFGEVLEKIEHSRLGKDRRPIGGAVIVACGEIPLKEGETIYVNKTHPQNLYTTTAVPDITPPLLSRDGPPSTYSNQIHSTYRHPHSNSSKPQHSPPKPHLNEQTAHSHSNGQTSYNQPLSNQRSPPKNQPDTTNSNQSTYNSRDQPTDQLISLHNYQQHNRHQHNQHNTQHNHKPTTTNQPTVKSPRSVVDSNDIILTNNDFKERMADTILNTSSSLPNNDIRKPNDVSTIPNNRGSVPNVTGNPNATSDAIVKLGINKNPSTMHIRMASSKPQADPYSRQSPGLPFTVPCVPRARDTQWNIFGVPRTGMPRKSSHSRMS